VINQQKRCFFEQLLPIKVKLTDMKPKKSTDHHWLSDFSDPERIFTVIVVAEIMVVIYSLSFLSFDFAYLNELAVLSLLAQLIAISVIVLLSKSRQWLNRQPVLSGLLVVTGMSVLLAVVYTRLMVWMDDALQFGLFSDSTLTTVRIAIATTLTLLALLRYFYVQDQWASQIAALSKAQMHALQARIKPHFLYNSLNSIASLIAFDPPAAERAVLNLSGLFRKAFTDHQGSMTTLASELEWIEQYLAIEKLRLMDRLQYDLQVDETLLSVKIPILTIQPLIENAVIHGIQHLSEGGRISLLVQPLKSGFRVQVSNPVNPGKQQAGTGTGLDNIKQRLTLKYADRLHFAVTQDEQFVVCWEVR
jgi:two-component system sensor histidine kinase AlgZ